MRIYRDYAQGHNCGRRGKVLSLSGKSTLLEILSGVLRAVEFNPLVAFWHWLSLVQGRTCSSMDQPKPMGDPVNGVLHDSHIALGPLPVYWTEERTPFSGMFGVSANFREEYRLGLATSLDRPVVVPDPVSTATLS
jgi:hypothetical protein